MGGIKKNDIELIIRNINFIVKGIDIEKLHGFEHFLKRLTTLKRAYDHKKNKTYWVSDKIYYGKAYKKGVPYFYFPISLLQKFIWIITENHISKDDIKITFKKHYHTASLDREVASYFPLKDYQVKYIDICSSLEKGAISFIDLPPGKGKTVISCNTIGRLNMRTGIIVLPLYIDKWILELKKYFNVTDDEYYVVQGSDTLKKLVSMESIEYKFILFSTRTITNYFEDFETGTLDKSLIAPDELMEHLQIGTIYSDESHQEFYSLYKASVYFDGIKFFGSSATLDSLAAEMKYLYRVVFPDDYIITGIVEFPPHIDVVATQYYIADSRRIKCKNRYGYSHDLFEKHILRNNLLLSGYVDMILGLLDKYYVSRKLESEKAVIFVSKKIMATLLKNKIKQRYPELKVNTFIQGDPIENLMESDVCVSTPRGGGTAHDIDKLIYVLNTVSIKSLQSNHQNPGRLREIKDRDTIYGFLYCGDIDNHKEMLKLRKETMAKMTKSFTHTSHSVILNLR
jgi:hypothetical protein